MESAQANPGELSGTQDDLGVREFLARRGDDLRRQNARLASRTLAFGALKALSDGYPQQAVLLGVEAVNESAGVGGFAAVSARDALRQALRELGGRPLIGRDDRGQSIAHSRAVTGMVGAPDGRWVATSSTDGTVIIWDLVKPGRFLRLPHDAPVSGLSLAPDGRWLATFSSGHPARLWDFRVGSPFNRPAPEPIALQGYSPPELYPTFSRDSRWLLLVGSDGGAMLWDLRPPAPGSGPQGHDLRAADDWIASAWTISPDSRWLSIVRVNGLIMLWSLGAEGPKARLIPNQTGAATMVRNAVFSEDSRRLVVTLINGRLHVVDPVDQPDRPVRVLTLGVNERGGPTRQRRGRNIERQVVATDYDGRWIVMQQHSEANTALDRAGGFVLWDVGAADRDHIPYPLAGFSGLLGDQTIHVLAGKYLVACGLDATILAWDLDGPTPHVPTVISGRVGPITTVVFDRDSKRIFSAGSDNSVWAWDLGRNDSTAAAATRPLTLLRGHDRPIAAMVLAGDKEAPVLVTGGEDSEVRRWDLRNFPARLTNEPQTLRGTAGWNTVVVTPRGDWLATATNSEPPQLRDLRHGDWTAPPHVLSGPAGRITSFVTSPDGRWLAANLATEPAAEAESDVWAWDLDAHDPAAQPLRMSGIDGYVATLRASRDGRWLAMTTNADGRPGGLPHAAYLRQAVIAPDGNRAIRSSRNPQRRPDLAAHLPATEVDRRGDRRPQPDPGRE